MIALLGQQEASENLLARVVIEIGLKLENGLRLVLREPQCFQVAHCNCDGEVDESAPGGKVRWRREVSVRWRRMEEWVR